MNFTDKLAKVLQTELEPSDATYLCFNTGGVEVEVGEFLYGLVRMIKPGLILETGTHKGISAAYMAAALEANTKQGGVGKLVTVEFLEPNYLESKELFDKMGIAGYIKQVMADAMQFTHNGGNFDLIFLDTEPQTRFAELERFYPQLNDGGFIMIHDLHPHMHQIPNEEHGFAWPYGKIPNGMADLVTSGKLIPFHFRTPRGFTLFYKPGAEDYQF